MTTDHNEQPVVGNLSNAGLDDIRNGPLNSRVGDRITILEYDILWTERHKSPEELEPLRLVGDPLADNCITALGGKCGEDKLDALNTYISKPCCDQESTAPSEFHRQITTIPDWVDWDLIQRGHDLYWAYSGPINVILLHYSLAGGFSAPRITKTLTCTKYFGSPAHTYRRLFETLQFVIYCMKGKEAMECDVGIGWQSIVRVRMLHSQVRLRITSLAEVHPDYYSVEKCGIPINQEDSISTLCAFSICVILGLEKIGIRLDAEEVTAYLHMWRLTGFYMGILPENDPLASREHAVAAFESFVNHLVCPDEVSATMTRSVLIAVADRTPLRWSFDFHSAISRTLLGDGLSDALKIGKSSWKNKLWVALLFTAFRWSLACTPKWFLSQWIRMSRHCTSRMVQRQNETTGYQCDFTMKMVPRK